MQHWKIRVAQNLLNNSNRNVRFKSNTQFVPKHEPAKEADIARLQSFLEDKPNILVLTGAGISTESGTPAKTSLSVTRHVLYVTNQPNIHLKAFQTTALKVLACMPAPTAVRYNIWTSSDEPTFGSDIGLEILWDGHDFRASNRTRSIERWQNGNAKDGLAALSPRMWTDCTRRRGVGMCWNCTAVGTMSFVWVAIIRYLAMISSIF